MKMVRFIVGDIIEIVKMTFQKEILFKSHRDTTLDVHSIQKVISLVGDQTIRVN